MLSRSQYSSLPEEPGIYKYFDKNGVILYVGKAKNLKKRVSSYFTNKDLGTKTQMLVDQIENIDFILVNSEFESLILEANQIKKYNPKYNMRLTDGKSYLRIKITIKDDAPKVLLARDENFKNSLYFGPFPNSSDVKLVLKLIRKIFPFQSVQNHPKRYCLYFHLGLCPCPPMFKTEEDFKEYKRNIKRIIKFLEGDTKNVLKDLESERNNFSANENFEKAEIIQKKINAITYITEDFSNPYEYEINPNFRSDLRNKELSELQKILIENGVEVENLERIECYDISNISGKFAVGSMVVLTDGEIDKSQYRRFQIKRPPKVVPNDFAMMKEVLSRRLNHKEWKKPSLIIVDGGKGQISSAQKAIFEANEDIPLIGIAKREELLITTDFRVIKLSHKSGALTLVRRIRDEAHRFAITYHRKLRDKYSLDIKN